MAPLRPQQMKGKASSSPVVIRIGHAVFNINEMEDLPFVLDTLVEKNLVVQQREDKSKSSNVISDDGLSVVPDIAAFIFSVKTRMAQHFNTHFDNLHGYLKLAKDVGSVDRNLVNRIQKLDNCYKELRKYSGEKLRTLLCELEAECGKCDDRGFDTSHIVPPPHARSLEPQAQRILLENLVPVNLQTHGNENDDGISGDGKWHNKTVLHDSWNSQFVLNSKLIDGWSDEHFNDAYSWDSEAVLNVLAEEFKDDAHVSAPGIGGTANFKVAASVDPLHIIDPWAHPMVVIDTNLHEKLDDCFSLLDPWLGKKIGGEAMLQAPSHNAWADYQKSHKPFADVGSARGGCVFEAGVHEEVPVEHANGASIDKLRKNAMVAEKRDTLLSQPDNTMHATPFTDTIENAAPYVADVCQRAACIAEARHRRFLGMLQQMLEEMRRDSA